MGYATAASGADAAGDFTAFPLVLTASNRVGIGTPDPAAKLHVNGNVNFTGLRTETTLSVPNVIGGSRDNTVRAGAYAATIGGGGSNQASGTFSAIGGGTDNTASGFSSVVPGGFANIAQGNYSFAAGRRAEAVNPGAFVWADSTDAGFGSTADNQFLIRAGGGVGIGTNSPRATLGLVGTPGNANLFMRAAATPSRGINFGVSGSAPNATLFIAQYNGTTYQDRLVINSGGTVSVNVLAAATGTHLCVNGTKLANCSSSLRYKERVVPFDAGLDLLSRLRPVTFKWKEREGQDLGLIAEEVNRVEPLLVTRDSAGEVQGVKYDQLSVVLINAVREQQAQISQQQQQLRQQQSQLERQRKQIEDLKRLVCLTSPGAEICR